jgi:hypothetical protein
MQPDDRIRVSTIYGARYPLWKDYMGAEGTVLEVIQEGPWEGYIRAQLDCDPRPGLFIADELERWPT